jgi:hypothetical protein
MTVILKKALYKISKHKWLADIGATSYMTDDFNIYRSLLKLYYKVI